MSNDCILLLIGCSMVSFGLGGLLMMLIYRQRVENLLTELRAYHTFAKQYHQGDALQ